MNKTLQKIIKSSKNEYAFVADNDDNIYRIKNSVDTGVYALNAMLSDGDILKGFPLGKRFVLAGKSSTAKSFFSMHMAKAWLESDPERFVIILESEGATVNEMCDTAGLDKSRVVVFPVKSIQDVRFQVNDTLSTLKEEKIHEKCMFILDSLGMLGSKKLLEDTEKRNEAMDMTFQKSVKDFWRTVSLDISLTQSIFITVAHAYSEQTMYGGDKVAGGEAVAYSGDIVLMLTKAKEKDGTKQVGAVITLKNVKDRFKPENQIIKILLSFKHGLYKYSHLLEVGKDLNIIVPEGHSYIFPDGQKVKKKEILANPKKYFTEENLKVISEKIYAEMSFGEGSESLENDLSEIVSDDE